MSLRIRPTVPLAYAAGRPDRHASGVGRTLIRLDPNTDRCFTAGLRSSDWSDTVSFAGHARGAGVYTQTTDVYPSTARTDPFGIALVDAMALGRPVVAIETPGPREVGEHGRSRADRGH